MTLNSKMGRWTRVVSALSDNFQETIYFSFNCSLRKDEVILATLTVSFVYLQSTCIKQLEVNQNLIVHFDVF